MYLESGLKGISLGFFVRKKAGSCCVQLAINGQVLNNLSFGSAHTIFYSLLFTNYLQDLHRMLGVEIHDNICSSSTMEVMKNRRGLKNGPE